MATQDDIALIKRIFVSYYENADFGVPLIEQREFGFGNVKKIDARHLSFASSGEFRRYLTSNTPLFVSHSTAYYDFPGATPIQKKHWRGADLVFDLDIHAEGKFGAYGKLETVKADLTRLVRDFVLDDFGVDERNVAVAFSGNRGYHVHVRDPAYFPLAGDERRELVDYVMGQGLDYLQFLQFDGKKLLGPTPEEGGYRGRFAREAIRTVQESPLTLSRKFTNEKDREFFISGIREGNWSRTTLNLNDLKERLGTVAKALPIRSVDTDVGVTQDLSKLIRVPNSIHGETGLIAKVIGIKDIEKFDPWKDAALEGPALKVRFTEDVPRLEPVFGGAGPFRKDEERELPQEQAVFFVLKGCATLSGKA